MNRVGSLIRGEWYENLHELSDDFRTQEILRFINCVLWGLNELPNISNSFNSTAERNISILEGGKIPDGMAFSDLIIMIYKATYTQLSERSRLINRLFELCSGENSMISIDSVFEVFSQRSVCDLISYEIPILQMFYGAFCTKKKSLKDIQKVIKGFNSFAEEYLWRSTSAFSRYLMPITSERNNFGGWVDISDLVYNGIGCENKLNDYCSRCESYLEEGEFPREENILLRLTRITKYADERYNKLEMTECWDVRYCRDNAHKLIVEIEYLLKIESFINESISWTDSNLLNIREIANDNLPKLIDGLYNRMCENIDYYGRNDIHRLLEHIYLKKRNVTLEEYKKLNEIVCKYCEKYNEGIAQWRLMLIQIRNEQIGDTTQKPDESR
jgi:hypothetical protein